MSAARNKLNCSLGKYISDTFNYIHIVIDFISRSPEWIKDREEESKKMRIESLSIYKDEAGLREGLEPTMKGLDEMKCFLEAVEKLAVTSVHVFDQNQVLLLSEKTDLDSVRSIVSGAQLISTLLLTFKRDDEAFFSPKLENLEVMQSQLNQYISNIKHICGVFKLPADLCLDNPSVDLTGVSEERIKIMLHRINELQEKREDKSFRTVYLFQGNYKTFMEEFREKKERMLQFLEDLEARAVELDNMTKGARISNVVGSSVGVLSGILSIVGLALIPVTFGASMALIGAGVGLGVLSGANAVVTTATEIGVNRTQMKKANEIFKNFIEDVNSLERCLNDVSKQHFENIQENPIYQKLKIANDVAAGLKVGMFARAAELSEAVAKGAKALSRAARGGFIALNALFIGVDLFLIVNNSIDLHKGTPNKASKWIRARAALWKSEIDSFQMIYDCLENQENLDIQLLQVPLYEG